MNNIEIKSTSHTPYVNLNAVSADFLFKGRSIPEDPGDFYSEIVEWIKPISKKKIRKPL